MSFGTNHKEEGPPSLPPTPLAKPPLPPSPPLSTSLAGAPSTGAKRCGRGSPWHGGVATPPTAGGRTGARVASGLSEATSEGGHGIIIRRRGGAGSTASVSGRHPPQAPTPGRGRQGGGGVRGGCIRGNTGRGEQGRPPPPPASPEGGSRSVATGKRPVQAASLGISPNKAKRNCVRAGGTGKTSTPGPGQATAARGLFALGITRAMAAQTPPPQEEGQGRAPMPQEDRRPWVRATAGPVQRIPEAVPDPVSAPTPVRTACRT